MKSKYNIFWLVLFLNCGYLASKFIHFENIPEPDGPFQVGCTLNYWIDESRNEWYLDDMSGQRSLMVQIWYPAKVETNRNEMFYIDKMEQRIKYISKELEVPEYLLANIKKIKSNSFYNAPIINGSFPVVLFSHGLGGMRTQNTIQAEALASRGYIVISADHTYDANITIFPNDDVAFNQSHIDSMPPKDWLNIRNKQLEFRIGDISFMIDKLEELNSRDKESIFYERLDLENIGIFGHSYGGATSTLSAMKEHRIDACLTLDAWFLPLFDKDINKNFNKPFLHIGQISWTDTLNYKKLDIFLNNCNNDYFKYVLKNAKHLDFTDIPHFTSLSEKLKISGKIEKKELIKIINEITIDFFGKYIKNQNPFDPYQIAEKYDELILLETNY